MSHWTSKRVTSEKIIDADDLFGLMGKENLETGDGWLELRQPCHRDAGFKVMFFQDKRALTLICPECDNIVVKIKVELKN